MRKTEVRTVAEDPCLRNTAGSSECRWIHQWTRVIHEGEALAGCWCLTCSQDVLDTTAPVKVNMHIGRLIQDSMDHKKRKGCVEMTQAPGSSGDPPWTVEWTWVEPETCVFCLMCCNSHWGWLSRCIVRCMKLCSDIYAIPILQFKTLYLSVLFTRK